MAQCGIGRGCTATDPRVRSARNYPEVIMRRKLFAFALIGLFAGFARGDEGMWTFNNFPKEKVGAKYNFTPDDKWLERVRPSSRRLAGGCSGSFVSADGLVMTNHHCAHSCIAQLSTAQKDFVK